MNLQNCNNAQNDAFVAKIANTRRTKIFVGIFALAEKLPTSATLWWGAPYDGDNDDDDDIDVVRGEVF